MNSKVQNPIKNELETLEKETDQFQSGKKQKKTHTDKEM